MLLYFIIKEVIMNRQFTVGTALIALGALALLFIFFDPTMFYGEGDIYQVYFGGTIKTIAYFICDIALLFAGIRLLTNPQK